MKCCLMANTSKRKTWKDVYVAGVKELYSRYPQKFISLIGDPDNETDVYIETAYRAHKLKGLKVLTKKQCRAMALSGDRENPG